MTEILIAFVAAFIGLVFFLIVFYLKHRPKSDQSNRTADPKIIYTCHTCGDHHCVCNKDHQ